MNDLPLTIGETFTFRKTVSESDVYLFAGITGDFSPNHVDEEYMKTTPFKRRIAHGVLSIGYSSTVSTQVAQRSKLPCVSYGYDRVRFIKPIFIGDTITVHYTIMEVDTERLKAISKIEIYNQDNELCTAAQHILKFIRA